MLTHKKPEPMEEEMATGTCTDSEKSDTSEESEPREIHESITSTTEDMREIECSSIQKCLDIIGESPLKRPSKVTPTYAKKKKSKVIDTLKQRLKDVMPTEDSEVKISYIN
jgi:hypothetical protein